ncbi:Brefeldin A resistance protein [Fusarium oxysporum f. sp. cepae]|nr:Brefeldin A resistance protein [Fusarium oxysporum f. sp. cepae]
MDASDSEQTVYGLPGGRQEAQKRLTVSFHDVGIDVHGLGEDFASTFISVITDWIPFKGHTSKRSILQGISGQVCPGEMLLVLGRPGSGCTSLLKVIANHVHEFPVVSGQVRYGNIGPHQAKEFRQHIVMNTEEDEHFPTLTVGQTIGFATSTKLPGTRPEHLRDKDVYASQTTNAILSSLAITHTKDTMVGNEFIRGVSGGERKRVSLAEVMATQVSREPVLPYLSARFATNKLMKAPLQCWDNSTRGLDASNALDFVRVLRRSADEEQKTIVSTLYQAGNSIFDQFDKVLVLAEGREIYYGPTTDARKYFEDMGFVCAPGANVADFLTAVAVHTERTIAPGRGGSVPNTAEEFEARYKSSQLFEDMMRQMTSTREDVLAREIDELKTFRELEKNRTFGFLSRVGSPYHASFFKQFEILWGDRWSNALQLASSIIMALVSGSLNYNLPNTSQSIFTRPGALFFPIMLWAMNMMSETVASFMGRPILTRHKRMAFNRPAAYAVACVLTDVPVVCFMYSLFELVYYFMVGFQRDSASNFFTLWFVFYLSTLCFTSLYRSIGAWCRHFGLASQLSGFVTMLTMVYAGYLIPTTSMHPWFRWIAWINPATYAFEAVIASEMGSRTMECVAPQFVPYGSTYEGSTHRSCTVQGSAPGDSMINGEEYIEFRYGATSGHIWRNVGVLIAFWVFFAISTAIAFEVNLHSGSGSKILYSRRQYKAQLNETDVEKAEKQRNPEEANISASSTVFTFKDISYFVHHEGQEKQLLQSVSGYVKPGQLVALMGSSGAGKTTLMDVLAQRKDSGTIDGSIMVNGKPQGISFQRTTGYCEQNDVHEPTATVLEALLFSARLRQPKSVPDFEKQDHVRRIMDLLELAPLRHAVIGIPGEGLSIEQRKRLTLAVELVAKPSLLFLDEPTSGLDGQSAYQICRFMRKLAASGQTVICTIHQPSATLFENFDVLLLLAKGGRTTYFGPTGENSAILLEYFARNGAPCELGVNPAEHIVDVVQGRFGTAVDWPQKWLDSDEYSQTMAELAALNTSASVPNTGRNDAHPATEQEEDVNDFATPVLYQIRLVTERQLVALWRNPDYVWNKIGLHVTNALFGGFTFWKIGNGSFDLQLRLMAIFNFVFVAPGCINQLQPFFIHNRDLFETREKKSKTYHWLAFVSAQLLSEIPILIVCATLYFACWYFTAGFPVKASASGQVYFQMILYEFLYTSIGQAIAAYSPNEYFAALANPLIIGAALISFCGVVVPYSLIPTFWRYWIYWLDPFTYLIGGLLEPVVWDVRVQCRPEEVTSIPLPGNTTCGDYMADFLSENAGTGADYMKSININASYYGWRDVGITALFCISSYALVFLMMKLRTRATKTAN